MKIRRFPEGFMWGSATSAYQVEGGIRNDWSVHERFDAGRASDHYNHYAEDFDMARSLGQNAHRISLEWARLEPTEGKFDEVQIEHYRRVLTALRERNLEPFVTIWHFTLPVWLAERGGVLAPGFADYFVRYADRMMAALGTRVRWWVTINEPSVYAGNAYLIGKWPPQHRSIIGAWRVIRALADAHQRAYVMMKRRDPQARIGCANYLGSLSIFQTLFIKMTRTRHDYLGVNYYHRGMRTDRATDMGWPIDPAGIYDVLRWLGHYKLPIIITENGLADALDTRREAFISDHLYHVHRAIEDGVDVRGYFHWSLVDNYEWDSGSDKRFGLAEVDYHTMERTARSSAFAYAQICRSNSLTMSELP